MRTSGRGSRTCADAECAAEYCECGAWAPVIFRVPTHQSLISKPVPSSVHLMASDVLLFTALSRLVMKVGFLRRVQGRMRVETFYTLHGHGLAVEFGRTNRAQHGVCRFLLCSASGAGHVLFLRWDVDVVRVGMDGMMGSMTHRPRGMVHSRVKQMGEGLGEHAGGNGREERWYGVGWHMIWGGGGCSMCKGLNLAPGDALLRCRNLQSFPENNARQMQQTSVVVTLRLPLIGDHVLGVVVGHMWCVQYTTPSSWIRCQEGSMRISISTRNNFPGPDPSAIRRALNKRMHGAPHAPSQSVEGMGFKGIATALLSPGGCGKGCVHAPIGEAKLLELKEPQAHDVEELVQ